MKKGKWIICVALLLLMPIVGACATKPPAPPAVEKVIRVGNVCDYTGPAAATVSDMGRGYRDFWRNLNEEQKGIEGIRIECQWVDAKYEVPLGIEAYERWKVLDKFVAIDVDGSHWAAALRPKVDVDHIVLTLPRTPPYLVWPVGYGFGVCACDGDLAIGFFDWFRDGKLKLNRPLKIAHIYQDNPFGRSVWASGALDYIKANPGKYEVVGDYPVPPLVPDVTTEITKMNAAKADLLYILTLKPECVVIADAVKRLKSTIPLAFASKDGQMTLDAAGALTVDYYYPSSHAQRHELDVKGIKYTQGVFEKYYQTTKLAPYQWGSGWITGAITAEGIRRALKQVGYDKLDGAAVRAALETFKGWDPDGLTTPITYTPNDHRGGTTMRVYYAKPGDLLANPITDFMQLPLIMAPPAK